MRKLLGTALLLTLSACGTTAAPQARPTPTPTTEQVAEPPGLGGCYTEQEGEIFTHRNGKRGLIMGKGKVGVIITNERRNDPCPFRPLAERLVKAGYTVLLYVRDGDAGTDRQIVALADRLKNAKLVLAGASLGAAASVPAANLLGERVLGVVSLSGDIEEKDAVALTAPLLQVGAENDGRGGGRDILEAHGWATKSEGRQKLVIPGETAHATDLLGTAHGPKILKTIVAFLGEHAPTKD